MLRLDLLQILPCQNGQQGAASPSLPCTHSVTKTMRVVRFGYTVGTTMPGSFAICERNTSAVAASVSYASSLKNLSAQASIKPAQSVVTCRDALLKFLQHARAYCNDDCCLYDPKHCRCYMVTRFTRRAFENSVHDCSSAPLAAAAGGPQSCASGTGPRPQTTAHQAAGPVVHVRVTKIRHLHETVCTAKGKQRAALQLTVKPNQQHTLMATSPPPTPLITPRYTCKTHTVCLSRQHALVYIHSAPLPPPSQPAG